MLGKYFTKGLGNVVCTLQSACNGSIKLSGGAELVNIHCTEQVQVTQSAVLRTPL